MAGIYDPSDRGASMRLFELAYACRLYKQSTGNDGAIREFQQQVGPDPDLANVQHRAAILRWLNDWGCRQFAVEHHPTASESLLTVLVRDCV
jgi:hypothetical protein